MMAKHPDPNERHFLLRLRLKKTLLYAYHSSFHFLFHSPYIAPIYHDILYNLNIYIPYLRDFSEEGCCTYGGSVREAVGVVYLRVI